ncbi:diacylglycerol kinase-like protein [Sarcoptes scabiei]|uniref:Diacylglycerol kinase n=1 Tax=Sarcoptes scabiei TaxID=52283 RepID=A0A131ZWM1_SARSC|nr:diacylglycerol kinase-like protein [Sarcoptes scabiei]
MLEESCDFGLYRRILVPSSWIVKLPRKGSFKSSIRRSPKNKRVSKKRDPGKLKLVNTSLGTNQLDSLSSTNTSDSNQSLDDTKSIDSLSSNDPSLFLNKSRTIASKDESFSPETNSKLLTIRSKASRLPHKSILAERIEASNRTLNDRPIKPQGKSSNTVFKDKSTMVNATASNASRSKHRRHSHANITSMSGSNLSSTDGHRNSLTSANNRTEHYLQHVHRSFVIKPIPSADLRPLLVFINPKSGGNQGAKLMQKFQWHLNPRQIFDLSQGGPRLGLDLFKKVHNLRILACGGDGTAGWVLSAIDEIAIQPPPPISVLPLGTGNDLARAFGWGGSYTDEPISKILCNIQDGKVVQLDRWNLKVQPNLKAQNHIFSDDDKGAKCNLPLDVVNNYFSIGVDAHIALSFHEAREAHPEKFNSRLRNKMFYGQAGGKDLLQRKWKDLCNYVNLECDGKDFTGRLKELKVHSVLFLNIPSYGGGTRPWPSSSSSCLQSPKTDDGFIEVIGLTTYQLPLLQAGGHGTIITQCRSAKIETSRTIPMQVDGEPCRLNPSLITLELRNKANLIANTKTFEYLPTLEKITLKIRKLNLNDYETYHYDKEHLKEISVTAERFFRIDRAQEDLYYVVDICHQDLFILDPQFDEKDDLDYYVTDEIISQVEIDDSSLIASPTKTSGFIEEQSYFSIGDGSLNSTLNESNSNPIESSSKNLESLETALPDAEIGDSPNHRTGPSEPYREGLKNLEKIRWSIKGYNDNGLSLTDGVKAEILVQKNDRDVKAASKILSPQKKSPKIFQKNSPKLKRFKLQNQLMLAAKNGDLSLLRHLHQRGVNLMLIDEKGISSY